MLGQIRVQLRERIVVGDDLVEADVPVRRELAGTELDAVEPELLADAERLFALVVADNACEKTDLHG